MDGESRAKRADEVCEGFKSEWVGLKSEHRSETLRESDDELNRSRVDV